MYYIGVLYRVSQSTASFQIRYFCIFQHYNCPKGPSRVVKLITTNFYFNPHSVVTLISILSIITWNFIIVAVMIYNCYNSIVAAS